MKLLKVIIISIIQGITEFLPVSSSGHILLFKNILHLDFDMTFDVAVHMGTLMAVCIYYRSEIFELCRGLFKKQIDSKLFQASLNRADILRVWLLFIIATIPAGIAGLLLEDKLDQMTMHMNRTGFLLLALFFSLTGLLLLLTRLIKKNQAQEIYKMPPVKAFFIGCFQALAVFPGVSRSGSTLSASLISGIRQKEAGYFSFLLSIPLILAAFLLKLFKFFKAGSHYDGQYLFYLVIAIIVSALTGYISLVLLINMIKKGKLWYFSFYMLCPVVVALVFAVIR